MHTIILLTVSNIFMTIAWYGHLKFESTALWKVVLISWGIAFVEYVFQVPANRLGAQAHWSGYQLKITQEAITLIVFSIFAAIYLKERLAWNNVLALILIFGAVYLTFGFRNSSTTKTTASLGAVRGRRSMSVQP